MGILYTSVRAYVRANPGVSVERAERIYGTRAVSRAIDSGQVTVTYLTEWDADAQKYVRTGAVLDAEGN